MIEIQPLQIKPIGIIHSPYGEKFSVPRQPELVKEGKGVLQLLPPYNNAEAVRGLTQFSHLWLIFQFHQIQEEKWHNTVRPPRLGGNERVGVFASRSTHRPNPIGLSKVALEKVEMHKGNVFLKLGSVDLVDGTPVYDIKPFLAYADNEPNANSGYAQEKPRPQLKVEFAKGVEQAVTSSKNFAKFGVHDPIEFITQVIEQDPRPAYQQGKFSGKIYGMTLADCNIRWRIKENSMDKVEIIELVER